jgi:hypothetical protein
MRKDSNSVLRKIIAGKAVPFQKTLTGLFIFLSAQKGEEDRLGALLHKQVRHRPVDFRPPIGKGNPTNSVHPIVFQESLQNLRGGLFKSMSQHIGKKVHRIPCFGRGGDDLGDFFARRLSQTGHL